MENMIQKIAETTRFLTGKGFSGAKFAVVLGTGLGSLIDKLSIDETIPYHDIPHFVNSTVEFHKGQLVLGTIGNSKVIIMQGRFHYYEGYSMQQITFPI